MASILVLEDDDNLRQLLVDSLEDAGYDPSGAANAATAIAMFQAQPFDLLLTDVRMAGALDGLGALEAIKRLAPATRSIIMTGYADPHAPLKAMELQADDYLLKGDASFGVAELLRAVSRALASEARQRSQRRGLWQRLLGIAHWPRQWLMAAGRPQLEHERTRCLNDLYLALRTAHLPPDQAYAAWAHVEALEDRYRQLDSPDLLEALTDEYRRVQQHMLQIDVLDPPTRLPVVSRARFAQLCKVVREGRCTPLEFQLAALLALDGDAARASARNFQLGCQLWGPSPQPLAEVSRVGQAIGNYRIHEHLEPAGPRLRFLVCPLEGGADRIAEVYTDAYSGLLERERAQGLVCEQVLLDGHHWVVRPWAEATPTAADRFRPGGLPLDDVVALLTPVLASVHAEHCQGRWDTALIPERIAFLSEGPAVLWFGHPDVVSTSLEDSTEKRVYFEGVSAEGPQVDQLALGAIGFQLWQGVPLSALAERMRQPVADASRAAQALMRMCSLQPGDRFPDLEAASRHLQLA